jgi:hypothetical protein
MATRAASHCERVAEEVNAPVEKLRFAMYALEKLGGLQTVRGMFRVEDGAALNTAIRYNPQYAAEMEKMETRAQAVWDEIQKRRMGPDPTLGPRKGSIQVGASIFERDPTGVMLHDGKRTNMRINAEHRCWVVAELSYSANPLRRHYESFGGRKSALLDAATLLIERENREANPAAKFSIRTDVKVAKWSVPHQTGQAAGVDD